VRVGPGVGVGSFVSVGSSMRIGFGVRVDSNTETDSGVEGRKYPQLKINSINATNNIEVDLNLIFASLWKAVIKGIHFK
jgi:hypothetical protein